MSSPSPESIRAAVSRLLDEITVNDAWIDASTALAARITRIRLRELHPLIRRLHEVDEGWIDRDRGLRVADRYPALRTEEICTAWDLLLNDAEVMDEVGPESDFDPLNALPFAFIDGVDIWYSVLTLPDVDPVRWPVVECMPMDDESVTVGAVDVEHFMHQWFCRDGPYSLSPVRADSEPEADQAIDLAAEVFGIDAAEARALWRADRSRAEPPPELAPYVEDEVLEPLLRLAVLPEE